MIDWVTVILPFHHDTALNGGHVLSFDGDGVEEWKAIKRMPVRGSYESNLLVKSLDETRASSGQYTQISIDGNFVKYHQGHNIFGTDDLTGLITETYIKVLAKLGLKPSELDLKLVSQGCYALKRADCTMMVDLGNLSKVEAFLYSAEQTAHLKHRGQGIMTKGTLYYGKHSRRWSLKMYAKGKEINSKGHTLPLDIDTPALQQWTDGKLRIELVLRSMELKSRGLHVGASWEDNTVIENLYASLEGLNMNGKHVVPPETLEGLPPRLVAVYHLWKEGHDLRRMYAKRTFYRYRKQLQDACEIDIAVKQGNRKETASNVVEFVQVLRPKACDQVPPWAVGTPLYFEPRARFN